MKTGELSRRWPGWPARIHRGAQQGIPLPRLLHLVRPCELQSLREALARRAVPLDLQLKLSRLAGDNLLHSYIERNSRLILALLLAAQDGSYRDATPAELELLLRILAYVRKDDDAIPDYQAGGYVDDHHEMRATARSLQDALHRFKLWRLRHEVPGKWRCLQATI